MPSLFLASSEPLAGKTAIIGALGSRLARDGRRVGYLKPVYIDTRALEEAGVADPDAQFLAQALGLAEPPGDLVPATLTYSRYQDLLTGRGEDLVAKTRFLHSELARARDVVFIEGGHTLQEGAAAGLSAPQVARELGAPVVLVARFRDEGLADEILGAARTFGGDLAGVVVNTVPEGRLAFVRETLNPFLERQGLRVLATLPEARDLIGMTVQEIADYLEGRIITNEDRSGDLVESMMIGAMSIDSGVSYYGRKENKVVIVAANRPDLTFPAFETSTRAVVLTGGLSPHPALVARSEEAGIPLILVGPETFPVVESMEEIFGRTKASHATKLERFWELFRANADLAAWGPLVGASL
jgi:BioD-like phosphotransacetylase family protein